MDIANITVTDDMDCDDANKAFRAIVDSLGITLTSTMTHVSENLSDPQKWEVVVWRNGHCVMTTPYSAGSLAIMGWYRYGDLSWPRGALGLPTKAEALNMYGSIPRVRFTLYAQEKYKRVMRATKAPPVHAIMEALVHDAAGSDEPFEDWAANLGFDEDSRKTHVIWQTCNDTRRALARHIPADALAKLYQLSYQL